MDREINEMRWFKCFGPSHPIMSDAISAFGFEGYGYMCALMAEHQNVGDLNLTPEFLSRLFGINKRKSLRIFSKVSESFAKLCQSLPKFDETLPKFDETFQSFGKLEASNPRGSIKEEREIEREKDTLGRFDEFWFAYPKKVGKAAVKRHWVRHGLDKRAGEIIDAVKCHKNSAGWLKDGGRYIPNPLTYLNQGRWDDEIQDEVLESALPEKGWI